MTAHHRKLKWYEVDLVIDFFLYYTPINQRDQFKKEFPVLYEKLLAG